MRRYPDSLKRVYEELGAALSSASHRRDLGLDLVVPIQFGMMQLPLDQRIGRSSRCRRAQCVTSFDLSRMLVVGNASIDLFDFPLRYEAELAGRTGRAVVDDIRAVLQLVPVDHVGDPACTVITQSVALFAAEEHFLVFVPRRSSAVTSGRTDQVPDCRRSFSNDLRPHRASFARVTDK
jgi:hypothetical protein